MITEHRYDAGWPRDDSSGCIADLVSIAPGGSHVCGRPEAEHVYTEYQHDPDPEAGALGGIAHTHMDKVRRMRGGRGGDLPPGKFEQAAGDMHEPRPYLGELDWPSLAQQPETD